MEPRRLAIHIFPSLEAGGAQLRTGELIRAKPAFDAPSFDHRIIALDGGKTRDLGTVWIPESCSVMTIPKAGSLATVRRLRHLLHANRPDLVLTYDWGAIDGIVANAISGRAPLIHHEDGFGDDERDRIKRRRTMARRVVLRLADRIVVPSQVLVERAARAWGITSDRLHHIANGVDTVRFGPRDNRAEFRRGLGLPGNTLLIGSVGRLAPIKDHRLLLEALARVPVEAQAHLVLAGTGEEAAAIQRRAKELGLEKRCHLLGHLTHPESLLTAIDIFALSSRSEQHPLVILEAMSCERPIVATDVGDIRSMLPEPQREFLVATDGRPKADAAAQFADRLTGLASSGEARKELGRANRDRALERFSKEGMVTAHHEVHRGVVLRVPQTSG